MKERFREQWNSDKRAILIFEVLCFIITIVLLIWSVIHPRPNGIFALICLIGLDVYLVFYGTKRENKYISIVLMAIGFLYIWTAVFDTLFPGRMVWEYEKDIAEEKQDVYLSYFPDEIPKDAKHVKWNVIQGYMNTNSSEWLYMECSKEYVKNYIDQYGTNAKIYTYDASSDSWGEDVYFCGEEYMDTANKKDYTIYILQDVEKYERSVYGFYVNEKTGEICLFEY